MSATISLLNPQQWREALERGDELLALRERVARYEQALKTIAKMGATHHSFSAARVAQEALQVPVPAE